MNIYVVRKVKKKRRKQTTSICLNKSGNNYNVVCTKSTTCKVVTVITMFYCLAGFV